MNKQNEEITIKGLIDIFLPKLWLIAILGVVFAGAFGFYSSFMKDDTYTSVAKFIMVKTPTKYTEGTNSAQNTGINANEIAAMQSLIDMSEQVMKTDDFLLTVKDGLIARDQKYENISIKAIRSMLSISLDGDGTVFNLTATSVDSKTAFDVTQVVYTTLPDVIKEVFDSYAIIIKDIQTPAEATGPNSKNTLRNTVVGLVAGVLLGMVIVFVVSKLDVVIRSKEKIENSFEIPVIGVIPRLERFD